MGLTDLSPSREMLASDTRRAAVDAVEGDGMVLSVCLCRAESLNHTSEGYFLENSRLSFLVLLGMGLPRHLKEDLFPLWKEIEGSQTPPSVWSPHL